MPVQTTKKGYVYYPDGAKVSVKLQGEEDWVDLGAIGSSVTNTLNWTETQYETANAGKLNKKISSMELSGGFTLINLDPFGIGKLGGGLFKITETEGASPVTPDAQTIHNEDAAGVTANKLYELKMVASGSVVKIKSTTLKPVITKVEAGSSTLTEDTDYTIEKSGRDYYIKFVAASSDNVVVTYGSNTPVTKVAISAGSSAVVLTPCAMKIDHEDTNGKHRVLDIYSVYSNSGGFQFNFKGANEDGVEEMPITFTANLDTSRTDKEQLFSWAVDTDAQ